MLRRTTLLGVLAIGALAILPAGAQAAAGPEAVAAAKFCNLSGKTRSLGPTYTTSLSVTRTTCAKGEALVKAYYKCRKRNGGKRGRCSSVSGYSCTERRSNVIRTQFDAKATCKNGRKVVMHTYTQFT